MQKTILYVIISSLVIFLIIGCSLFPQLKMFTNPSTPKGLMTEETTSYATILSWYAVNDAEGYKIFKSRQQNTGYQLLAEVTEDTGYNVSGLNPDTDYYFRVCSVNQVGESDLSNYALSRTLKIEYPNLISGYCFKTGANPQLSAVRRGTIDENKNLVFVNIPDGTDVTGLIADLTVDQVNVKSITINGQMQTNGVTPNDFTYPLVYLVEATDDSITAYTVVVQPAPENLYIQYTVISTWQNYYAFNNIETGPVANFTQICDTTLSAGNQIILKSGTVISEGARFRARIDENLK